MNFIETLKEKLKSNKKVLNFSNLYEFPKTMNELAEAINQLLSPFEAGSDLRIFFVIIIIIIFIALFLICWRLLKIVLEKIIPSILEVTGLSKLLEPLLIICGLVFTVTLIVIVTVSFFNALSSYETKSENGELYKWESTSKSEWKTFGDLEFHQKYVGDISNEEPDGDGILYYPDGKKLVGIWRKGNLDSWYENGKLIRVLYGYYDKDGYLSWSVVDEEANYDLRYEGEYSSKEINFFDRWVTYYFDILGLEVAEVYEYGLHGFGTLTSQKEIYIGNWEDGMRHGEGTLTMLKDERAGIKVVGVWKDGKQNNTITYDKDGNILCSCDRKPLTAATMELEFLADGTICDTALLGLYLIKLKREKSSN